MLHTHIQTYINALLTRSFLGSIPNGYSMLCDLVKCLSSLFETIFYGSKVVRMKLFLLSFCFKNVVPNRSTPYCVVTFAEPKWVNDFDPISPTCTSEKIWKQF